MRQAKILGTLLATFALGACQPKEETKADPKGEIKDPGTVNTDDGGDDGSNGTIDGSELVQGGSVELGVVSAGQVAVDASGLHLTNVGQANGVQLESLQYRISSIQVCETRISNGGTGGTGEGCMEIFKDEAESGTSTYDQAKADPAYVDLMDQDAVDGLTKSFQLNSSHVRQYNWGLVFFATPIKVKASVVLNATPPVTLYTKDVPWVSEIDQNGIEHFKNRVDAITTGPAQLGVVKHNNGGTAFRFAKPLVITEEDITSKRNFKLDLVFNPDGIVKGSSEDGMMIGGAGAFGTTVPSGGTHPRPPAPYYGISVPMINFSPIAHAAEQKIVREQYLVHYAETYNDHFPPNNPINEEFDIRIELYSLKGDATNSVYGVDTELIYTAGTKSAAQAPYDPTYVVEKPDGEIELQNYAKNPFYTGFRRLMNPGDTGTMIIKSGSWGQDGGAYCLPPDMHPQTGCPQTIRDVAVTYELVRIDEL